MHTNRVLLPEDEMFVRQLEQIIAETMQASYIILCLLILFDLHFEAAVRYLEIF